MLGFLYKVAFAISHCLPRGRFARWWFFKVVTPLYDITFDRNVGAKIPKRRKLARMFWCVDGGRRWVIINLRGKVPAGFDEFKEKIVTNPSDEYLARLEQAVPKLWENGFVVQKVAPFSCPDSPGGWRVF